MKVICYRVNFAPFRWKGFIRRGELLTITHRYFGLDIRWGYWMFSIFQST